MQLIRSCIQCLIKTMRGIMSPIAQDDTADLHLYINKPIDDPQLCTREQATTFYDTLDGFQQLLGDLEDVKDGDALGVWFAEFNNWTELQWAPVYDNLCDGTSFFTRALRAHAMWQILSRGSGLKGPVPADEVMETARIAERADRAAMAQSDDPNIRLTINSLLRVLPRCGKARTFAFYQTINTFEEQARALMAVDSYESLQSWITAFHDWREENWATFYIDPCGLTIEQIYYIESRTYLAALMQWNDDSDGASNMLANLIQGWRAMAADDLAIIHRKTGD